MRFLNKRTCANLFLNILCSAHNVKKKSLLSGRDRVFEGPCLLALRHLAAESEGGFSPVWLAFLWLRCVDLAAVPSLVAENSGLLGRDGSVAAASGLRCHMARGNLPGPGVEPVSPALAGGFFYYSSHQASCNVAYNLGYMVTWPGEPKNNSMARFSIQEIPFQWMCRFKTAVRGSRPTVSPARHWKCTIWGQLLQILPSKNLCCV